MAKRKSAPEVGDLVKCLEADFKLVGSLGWSSPLLEYAIDEVNVDRAWEHYQNVIVRVRNSVSLAMQVRIRVTWLVAHGVESK